MFCVSHNFALFIAASWSPAEKGLTSWLLLVMFIVFFVTFPCGILGQVWYLIVSFPYLCRLSDFVYLCSRLTSSRCQGSGHRIVGWAAVCECGNS